METQGEYHDLENRLRILQLMVEDQTRSPIDINTTAEYGHWLSSQLDAREQAQAEQWASFLARLFYKGRRSINRIWPIIAPNVKPPRSRRECHEYARVISASMVHMCRNSLGATLEEVMLRIGSFILAEGDSMEQRWERIQRVSEPVNLRLGWLIRRDAGALVDLYFGRYKRYRALSGAEQEELMDALEDAGARGMLNAIYHVWIPPVAASLLPIFEETILPVFDQIESSLDSFIAFSSVLFPLLLDMVDDMTTELAKPHSELRETVEESIHHSISENCQQLVEEEERYNERYRSRREDRHLTIIGLDLPEALYWDIALEAKGGQRTIKQLAERDDVDPKDVYNVVRSIKYNLDRLGDRAILK